MLRKVILNYGGTFGAVSYHIRNNFIGLNYCHVNAISTGIFSDPCIDLSEEIQYLHTTGLHDISSIVSGSSNVTVRVTW